MPSSGASSGNERAEAAPDAGNARLLRVARELNPGHSLTIFQLGLEVEVQGWRLRGVLDLLRISRTCGGALQILIADMKASQRAKVEHRLYYRMVETLFREAHLPLEKLEFGILYRGPQNISDAPPREQETLRQHQAAAQQVWGLNGQFFELCDEVPTYLNSLDRLVFNSDSQARVLADKDFEALNFYLSSKCDACVFSEFCLRSSAESQDIALLPYLTPIEKAGLHKHGIHDIPQLAVLKTPRNSSASPDDPHGWNDLETPLKNRPLVAKLAGDREVGARLDELIHRAHSYTKTPGFKSYIPSKGEGTLPFVSPEVNANIVRIYLDCGLDYVHNRAYLLGALLVAYQEGVETARRSVVSIAPQAPTEALSNARWCKIF